MCRHQRIKWRYGVKGTVEQSHENRQIYEWSDSGFKQSTSPLWPSKRERIQKKTKPKQKPKQTQSQQMLWNLQQPGLNIIQVTGQIWQSGKGWNYVLTLTPPLGTMRVEIICLNHILLLLIFLKCLILTLLTAETTLQNCYTTNKKSGQAYLGKVASLLCEPSNQLTYIL